MDAEPGTNDAKLLGAPPPAKRTKKGKKKVQGLPRAADYLKVTPLQSNADILEEDGKPVQLSKLEKAQQVVLSEDGMSITSHKGYRMARATRGAYVGTWYFEVRMTHLGATGHCRLGWSTKKGELQAPVGYDEHSLAYRDLEGSKVHKALREDYGAPFAEGDVIGCFLHMPEGGRPMESGKEDVWRLKNRLVIAEQPEQEAKSLAGSVVAFTKNGEFQGVAFRDITEGTYYPAASLYTLPEQTEGATVTFNFGPDFAFPPPAVEGCLPARPVSELSVRTTEPKGSPPAEAAPPSQTANGTSNGTSSGAGRDTDAQLPEAMS
ncbi:Set1/Ash2 histone methyltransferase complex subunit ASH2 [Coccomyxa sp. Obi]|nr:Set1/Ash2 histone methyltransferase complex subunit ASH2 [Coccomyxa sp. Obi]